MNGEKKSNGLALIPLLLFIVMYFGVGIVLELRGVEDAFYQFPSPVAMMIAVISAFLLIKGNVEEKFDSFVKGCGDSNIIIMCTIYLLAGAFSSVAGAMGGVESTVNLGLTLIPTQFITAGVFIISAFIAMATGTSVGTIGAMASISLGIADKAGLSIAMILGATIAGAMFGDNLSVISDTTIAATRTQNVEMRDKFRVNLMIVLPVAILSLLLYAVFGAPTEAVSLGALPFNLVKVLPYIAVLILALAGINVFVVLTGGIIVAGIIGLAYGDLTFLTLTQSIYNGFLNMTEVFLMSLFVGGLAGMIADAGGINFLIEKIKKIIKGAKSAEVGIDALVSITNVAVANNTVSIIINGPIAKEISTEYKVDPRRTASLLDIFACVIDGFLPYGTQLLLAGGLALAAGYKVAPIQIIPYLWYLHLLVVSSIVSIYIPFANGIIRKDPWNFEQDKPQSKVSNTTE